MPAAAVKGIIVSISIITALGVAVLENPQIQAWLEQQRQRIIELLRQLGEELDPASRRAAEAFAFEGRTINNDVGLRREATGSLEAAAVATGRSLSNPSTIRRIPVHGPSDPDEAEERRRKGREYLAQRNQQMYEMRERRKATKTDGSTTPPTPTSFDAIVDDEGKLKEADVWKGKEKEVPDFPSLDDVPEHIKADMREVEKNLVQPMLVGEASSSAEAWQLGSRMANPFSDEYALDRSETLRPPVPPKIALEEEEEPRTPTMPGSFTPRQPEPAPQQANDEAEELSYEEQLAIALSLSEAEAQKAATATVQEVDSMDEDDPDLRAAIEASLKDMRNKLAPKAEHAASPLSIQPQQPLVDLTPTTPTAPPLRQPAPRGHWETLFDQDYSPTQEPLSMLPPKPIVDEEDELYRVTPQLTHARLASHDSQQASTPPTSIPSQRYDPVREAAQGQVTEQQLQAAMEASFYSATSSAPSPAATSQSRTLSHEATPIVPQHDQEQLIDVSESATAPPAEEGLRTPISHSRSSFSFRTDDDSDSDTFASVSPMPVSRTHSRARSEVSNVEVVDLLEDSDVDMLSEEGDGIATPDSWTEVGSRDGNESETDDDEDSGRRRVRVI